MLNKIKLKRKYLENQPSAFDDISISWIAPEHIQHYRGKLWKVIMVGLLLSAITLGIIYKAWTFSLAILVFAAVYYLINREPNKEVEVKISEIGIKVGNRKYPFTRIKSFWLIYDPPYTKTLYIKVNGELVVDIPIQLNEQNPSPVREFLIEKIPEKEGHSMSFSEIFSRLLKI